MSSTSKSRRASAPYVDAKLLAYLRETFPELAPSRGEAHDDMVFRGGQVSVVRHLDNLFENQERTDAVGMSL
jgi:hypothetical protein